MDEQSKLHIAVSSTCPVCDYELLGGGAVSGEVDVCPECGASAADRVDFARRVRAYGRLGVVLLVLTALPMPVVLVMRWMMAFLYPSTAQMLACFIPFLLPVIFGWLVLVPIMLIRDHAARRSSLPLTGMLAGFVVVMMVVILLF